MNTHICLISDQILANLLPILYYKPAQVHLVVSAEMQTKGKAKILQDLLDARGIAWTAHADAPDTGYAAITDFAAGVIQQIKQDDGTSALNVTGGTKPMAMGFMEVFRRELPDAPVFYTDTNKQRIEFLHPPGFEDLPEVVDARTYLHANGFAVTNIDSEDPAWQHAAEARRELTYWLAGQCGERNFQNFLGCLNSLAARAVKTGNLSQSLSSAPRGIWAEGFKRLQSAGLLRLHDLNVKFSDASHLPYCNGHWLEEYAWLSLREAGFERCYRGIEGDWLGRRPPGSGTNNEFDVVVIRHNRFQIIECKTAVMVPARGNNQEFMQAEEKNILDKLDNLRAKAGGIFSRALLLSARPLREADRNRAMNWNINVLEGADIIGLANKLTTLT